MAKVYNNSLVNGNEARVLLAWALSGAGRAEEDSAAAEMAVSARGSGTRIVLVDCKGDRSQGGSR